MSHVQDELLYDPTRAEAHADPYPMYRRLREQDPVHRTPFGFWVLTRFADVTELLRTPHVASSFHTDASWAARRGGPDSAVVSSTREWMLMTDGAAHRRIRGLVNHVFTARAIGRLEGRIIELIDELVSDVVRADGPVDLIARFALPLPVIVICEMLGLPAADREQCRRWTEAIGHVVDPIVTREMSADMNRATEEFAAYIAEQLGRRRADPRDDVLSLLADATVDGEVLTDDEIVANVLLLFSAGHETSVNLIGNGLLALLSNPAQLAAVRARGGLRDRDVDELLRYDAPVQLVARLTTADVVLGDAVVPAGSKVMLLLGAANHDPDQYAEPDELDLDREGSKPVSFGGGAHYCIGALLGKLEARHALTRLVMDHELELCDAEPDWRSNINFRGLHRLPLLVRPA